MKDRIRYIGLDVHKLTITMAVADEGRGEAKILGRIPNSWDILLKRLCPFNLLA